MGSTRTTRRAIGAVLAVALAGGLWPLVVTPAASAEETVSPVEGLHRTTDVTLAAPEGTWPHIAAALPSDRLLAVGATGLDLYAPATGAHLVTGDQTEQISDLVVTDDGARVYTLEHPRGSGPASWVAAYDGATLDEVGRITLPGWCPYGHVALAGGRVWVSCNSRQLGFGSVAADLNGAWDELELPAVQALQSPSLGSVGDDAPALLVGGNVPVVGRGDVVLRLALDGGDAEVVEAIDLDDRWQDEVHRLQVSPDHQLVLVGTAVRDAETLEVVHRFPLRREDAVAGWHADSGHLLGSVEENYLRRELALWAVGHDGPTSGAAFPVHFGEGYDGGTILSSADGERLYVQEESNVLATVHLGAEPARLALDPPGTGGAPGVLTGRLSLTDGTLVLGQPVTVERVGPSGALPVGIGLAAADGRFTVVDPLGAPTPSTTYRARWLGDLTHPLGAIALRLGNGSPAPSLLATTGLDLALPMRRIYPNELVVDEVHGRAFVLGNVTFDAYDDRFMAARVDVYTLAGLPAGSLVLPDEPSDIQLTRDSSHLLVALPKLGRVDVLDAATLLRVGSVTTAPLTLFPRSAQVIGDQLWVHGTSGAHVAPLSAPLEGRRPELSCCEGPAFIPDPARPTEALQAYGGTYPRDLYRWDLSTDPPTIIEGIVRDPRPNNRTMVVPQVEGPLFEVWTHGIRTLDRDTFEQGATRLDPERPGTWQGEWRTRAAPGPQADQVIAVVSGPDEDEAPDTEVVVWDDRAAPYRRYDLGTEFAQVLDAGRTGAVAAVVTSTEGQTAAYTPPATVLRILRDPFGNGPTRPFADLADLVDRHIRDLLGVSVPEATAWFVEQLEEDAFTTGEMAAWLLAMSEPTRGVISRLYLAARGRFPTAPELAARERELWAGRSLSTVATTIAGTAATGRTALATAQSKAYVDGVAPYVEADLAHLAMLGRNATWAEITTWLVARAGGRTTGQLFDELRTGAEYARRIGALPPG